MYNFDNFFDDVTYDLEDICMQEYHGRSPGQWACMFEEYLGYLDEAIGALSSTDYRIYFKWSATFEKYNQYEEEDWDTVCGMLPNESVYLVIQEKGKDEKIIHEWDTSYVMNDFKMGEAGPKLYAILKNIETKTAIESLD